MQCPYCADDGNRVIDSRLTREGSEIRRRRECDECGQRFTTRERIEETMPRVIKHDERREEFDRTKLQRGIQHACVKRPVSTEAVERLVDRVERGLLESGQREVTSDLIGRRVLDELSDIDVIAAVRWASVFRNFSSPSDYAAFFAEVDGRAHGGGASASAEEDAATSTGAEAPVRSLRASR